MPLSRSSFNTCFVFVWRFDPVFRYWLDLPISLSIGKLFKIRKVLNQFQIRHYTSSGAPNGKFLEKDLTTTATKHE